MAARHHYIPQFYLRKFSDARRKLRIYEVGQPGSRVTSVRKTAAVCGFYTAAVGPGGDTEGVEKLLSVVEAGAKPALDRLLNHTWPPSLADRACVADFIAFQMMRTPERREIQRVTDKAFLRVSTELMTVEDVAVAVEAAGIDLEDQTIEEFAESLKNWEDYDVEVQRHQNDHLLAMLEFAPRISPRLAQRAWSLGVSREGRFLTSDHPFVDYTSISASSGVIGLGLDYADRYFLPLDPHHVLILARQDRFPTESIADVDDRMVSLVNALEVNYCVKYVFQNPSDADVHTLIREVPRDVAPTRETEQLVLPYVERVLSQDRSRRNSK